MRVPNTIRLVAASWLLAGCGPSGEEGPRVPPYTADQATTKVQAQQELPAAAVIHAETASGTIRPDSRDESSSEREKRVP